MAVIPLVCYCGFVDSLLLVELVVAFFGGGFSMGFSVHLGRRVAIAFFSWFQFHSIFGVLLVVALVCWALVMCSWLFHGRQLYIIEA